MSMKCSLLLCNLFFVTSCGWHMVDNSSTNKRTLAIPYVHGDGDGLMTAELVKEVEKQGAYTYVAHGGELTLQVSLLDSRSDNIGFRYDPEKLSDGKRKIIPSEVRRKLLATVTIIETASQKVLLGPAYILGSTDFDHEYYILNNNINTFSMGQLTDIDTTYDVVDIPLHRNLAKNIAEYIENHANDMGKE